MDAADIFLTEETVELLGDLEIDGDVRDGLSVDGEIDSAALRIEDEVRFTSQTIEDLYPGVDGWIRSGRLSYSTPRARPGVEVSPNLYVGDGERRALSAHGDLKTVVVGGYTTSNVPLQLDDLSFDPNHAKRVVEGTLQDEGVDSDDLVPATTVAEIIASLEVIDILSVSGDADVELSSTAKYVQTEPADVGVEELDSGNRRLGRRLHGEGYETVADLLGAETDELESVLSDNRQVVGRLLEEARAYAEDGVPREEPEPTRPADLLAYLVTDGGALIEAARLQDFGGFLDDLEGEITSQIENGTLEFDPETVPGGDGEDGGTVLLKGSDRRVVGVMDGDEDALALGPDVVSDAETRAIGGVSLNRDGARCVLDGSNAGLELGTNGESGRVRLAGPDGDHGLALDAGEQADEASITFLDGEGEQVGTVGTQAGTIVFAGSDGGPEISWDPDTGRFVVDGADGEMEFDPESGDLTVSGTIHCESVVESEPEDGE